MIIMESGRDVREVYFYKKLVAEKWISCPILKCFSTSSVHHDWKTFISYFQTNFRIEIEHWRSFSASGIVVISSSVSGDVGKQYILTQQVLRKTMWLAICDHFSHQNLNRSRRSCKAWDMQIWVFPLCPATSRPQKKWAYIYIYNQYICEVILNLNWKIEI